MRWSPRSASNGTYIHLSFFQLKSHPLLTNVFDVSLCLCEAQASKIDKANKKSRCTCTYHDTLCYKQIKCKVPSNIINIIFSTKFSTSSSRFQNIQILSSRFILPSSPGYLKLKNEDPPDTENRSLELSQPKSKIEFTHNFSRIHPAVLQGGTRASLAKYFKENAVLKGQPPG